MGAGGPQTQPVADGECQEAEKARDVGMWRGREGSDRAEVRWGTWGKSGHVERRPERRESPSCRRGQGSHHAGA